MVTFPSPKKNHPDEVKGLLTCTLCGTTLSSFSHRKRHDKTKGHLDKVKDAEKSTSVAKG